MFRSRFLTASRPVSYTHLPGKRYYGGCEYVDEAETLAKERALKLFCEPVGVEMAVNVQPVSYTHLPMASYSRSVLIVFASILLTDMESPLMRTLLLSFCSLYLGGSKGVPCH